MASAMETGITSLNPNAEPFIPMAYRLVEDFSPLWWELVKTSPWFQDYWSTHHRLDDYDEDLDGIEDDDVWVDDGLEFVGPQYVNESSSPFDFFALEKKLQKGVQTDVDAKAMLKKLNLGIPDSIDKGRGSNPRGPSWCCKNKQQQRIKYVAPKSVVRRIHQPR